MSSHGSNEDMNYKPIPGKHHKFKTPFKKGHPRNPSSAPSNSVADDSETQYGEDGGDRPEPLFRFLSSSPSIKSEVGFLKRKATYEPNSSDQFRSTPPHAAPFSSSPSCSSPSIVVGKKAKEFCHLPAPLPACSQDAGRRHINTAPSRSYQMSSDRIPVAMLAGSACDEVAKHLENAATSPDFFADQAALEKTHKATDFVVDAFTRKIVVEKEETYVELDNLRALLWKLVDGIERVVTASELKYARQTEEGLTFAYRACLLYYMSRVSDDGSIAYLESVRDSIKKTSLVASKLAKKHKNWAAQLVELIAVDVKALEGQLDTYEGQEGLCAYFLARHNLANQQDNQMLARSFLRKMLGHSRSLPRQCPLLEQVIVTSTDAAANMLALAEISKGDDSDEEECNSSVGSFDGAADERTLSKSIANLRRANTLLYELEKVMEDMPRPAAAHLHTPLRDKAILHSRVLHRLAVATDKLKYRLEYEHALFNYRALSTVHGDKEDVSHATVQVITSMEDRGADLSSIEVQWAVLLGEDGGNLSRLDSITEVLSKASKRSRDGEGGKLVASYIVAVSTQVALKLPRSVDGNSQEYGECILKLGHLVTKEVDDLQVDGIADFLQVLADRESSLDTEGVRTWLARINEKATAVIAEQPVSAFKILSLATSLIFRDVEGVADMTRLAAVTAIEAGLSPADDAVSAVLSIQPEDVQTLLHCLYHVRHKDEELAVFALQELVDAQHCVPKDVLIRLIMEAKSRLMPKLANAYIDMVWTIAEQEHSLASLELLRDYVALQCELSEADRSIGRDGGEKVCGMLQRCAHIIALTLKGEGSQEEAMAKVVGWFVQKTFDLASDDGAKWTDETKWFLSATIIEIVDACLEYGILMEPTVFDIQLGAGKQHVAMCYDFAKAAPKSDKDAWINMYKCAEACETFLNQARSALGFLPRFDVIETVLIDYRLKALLEAQEWSEVVKLCGIADKPLADASFEKVLNFVSKSKDAPPAGLLRHVVEVFMTRHDPAVQATKTYDAKLFSPWIVRVAQTLTLKRSEEDKEEYEETLNFMQIIVEAYLTNGELNAEPAWPESDLSSMRMHTAKLAEELMKSKHDADFKCSAALRLLDFSIALSNSSRTKSAQDKQAYERWRREDQQAILHTHQPNDMKQESDLHIHPTH